MVQSIKYTNYLGLIKIQKIPRDISSKDSTAQDEWVYFEYVGQTVADCGLDNTEYQHKGVLDITIVGASRFRVNEIADSIMSLYKGSKIGNTFVKGVNILGTGILQDTSKSYMDMNLQISML